MRHTLVNFSKLRYLENLLLIITFLSLMFPLQTKVAFFNIFLYNLPLYALIFIGFIHRVESSSYQIGKADLWNIAALMLLFWLLISALLSPHFKDSFPQLIQFAHFPLLGIYFRSIYKRKIRVESLILLSFIIVALQAGTGIVQQLTDSHFGNIKAYFGEGEQFDSLGWDVESAFSRIEGTLDHPNLVGAWLITCTPFLLIAKFYQKYNTTKWWLFRIILFFLSTVTILFTFSRGSIVIFVLLLIISLPFYLKLNRANGNQQFLNYKFWKGLTYTLIFIGLVGFIIVKIETINLLIDYASSRINDTFAGTSKQVSADYRLLMNEAAIKYINLNPVLGIGLNHGHLIYKTVGFFDSNLEFRPHNTYLLMGVEGGIFAMLSFIFLTIYPLIRLMILKKRDPLRYALIFSLLACLGFIQIYLITVAGDFAPLYFILMGIAMGYVDSQYTLRKGKFT